MIHTDEFKTKTEFHENEFPERCQTHPIGLDVGYSGVKVMCPSGAYCFPAYAKKIGSEDSVIKSPDANDIYYRDGSGTWCVGEAAYAQIGPGEDNPSDSELFGRSRYYTPIFSIVANVGIALACRNGIDRRVTVQTGLPPKYAATDTQFLVDALSGKRTFEVKIGKNPWREFAIDLSPDDIKVMPQPKGALISASIGKDGMATPVSKRFFSSNVIIPDTGFGTFDIYTITNGYVSQQGTDTFPNLGMREVFSRTCRDIMESFGTEITVPGLQNYLSRGTVPVIDPKSRKRSAEDFTEILNRNLEDVCHESVEMIMNLHYYCRDTDYIIPAGGAYDIWDEIFNAEFADMDGLSVIPANVNDRSLGNVFSNVRGYYFNIAMRG